MLLIHGSARPLPERREELIQAAAAIATATQNDDGCLYYQFVQSLDSTELIGIEVWRDQAALDAHMSHQHTTDFLSGLDGAFSIEPVMTRIELQ